MNENEFEYYGIVFVSGCEIEGCKGCAFLNLDGCTMSFDDAPPCSAIDRSDGRNVIFVEKQP